jgi:hypothetical protein
MRLAISRGTRRHYDISIDRRITVEERRLVMRAPGVSDEDWWERMAKKNVFPTRYVCIAA